ETITTPTNNKKNYFNLLYDTPESMEGVNEHQTKDKQHSVKRVKANTMQNDQTNTQLPTTAIISTKEHINTTDDNNKL
ncbi:10133_t:CDS:1, partial [Dentiscutata erythropus]